MGLPELHVFGYDLDQMCCSTVLALKRITNVDITGMDIIIIIIIIILISNVVIMIFSNIYDHRCGHHHHRCNTFVMEAIDNVVVKILLSSSQSPFPLFSSSSSCTFIQNHSSMPINIHYHPPISPCPQSNICALGERVCI